MVSKVDNIIDAVVASASIPGFFPPVKLADETYVDGGVREILPIQVAIEAGAEQIFAIIASPSVASVESFDGKDLIAIVERSVLGIMSDEIVSNEAKPPTGWNNAVTVIHPRVELYDIMTRDPGLIRISMDYGYMCVADEYRIRQNPLRSKTIADEITSKRKRIWDLEYDANGIRRKPHGREALKPVPDPEMLVMLRELKREVYTLVLERKSLGSAVPKGYEQWWLDWEAHPWDVYIPIPWDRFVSAIGVVDAGTPPDR